MEPATLGALIGAGGSILSGVIGSSGASDQNAANRSMTNKKMVWDLKVANSAHQRQVRDLRAAGLNPLLSVNRGAPSPSAAVIPAENTAKAGIEAANNTRLVSAQVKSMLEQAKKTEAETKLTKEKTKTEIDYMRPQITAAIQHLMSQKNLNLTSAEGVMYDNFEKEIMTSLYREIPQLKMFQGGTSGTVGNIMETLLKHKLSKKGK